MLRWAFERPSVGAFCIPQNEGVVIMGANAKVDCIDAASLIFNRFHEEIIVPEPKFDRPLVDFVA